MIRKTGLVRRGRCCRPGAVRRRLFAELSAQPIRIVVSSSPGGPNDTVARLASQIFMNSDSRPWSRIAPARAVRSPRGKSRRRKPDGYTLMVGNTGTMAVIPEMQAKPGYNSLKDFVAVAKFWESYQLLVVHSSSPWKTAKDLIDAAKAEPGKITYAHTGPGGSPHFRASCSRPALGSSSCRCHIAAGASLRRRC